MNKNALKNFSRSARRKLIEQVHSKLRYVLNTDSAELRNKEKQIRELKKQLENITESELVEKVAYTWFNRFVALRFMDANGYTPVRVVSPAPGFTMPEILMEAKKGYIDESLNVDREKIDALLDGRIPAADPQNEVYRMLLVAACNYYHNSMPFMFERINDYTELLMPDDLLSEHSILWDIVHHLSEEDCRDVEIIGWLYQFYISERKDEVFQKLRKNIKIAPEDIPAATQLFTPHWIVRYMAENSVGKLWLTNHPDSGLKKYMSYYVESDENHPVVKVNSPEEITILDPACGSGHILVYAFDLLTKIYEEQGYDPHEIPYLILQHNLFGIEIDERAASLASFALVMKARAYYRRFLRKPVQPNVIALKNIYFTDEELEEYFKIAGSNLFTNQLKETLNLFENAQNIGSLLQPELPAADNILQALESKGVGDNLFLAETHKKVLAALKFIQYLQREYHCVITNPPYMGSKGMNPELSNFVKKNYPDSKADLFSCFIERCLDATCKNGYTAMITQHSWMFLSSFEKLRQRILKEHYIDTMVHLGPRAFEEIGGEVVQTVTFVLQK